MNSFLYSDVSFDRLLKDFCSCLDCFGQRKNFVWGQFYQFVFFIFFILKGEQMLSEIREIFFDKSFNFFF